MPRTTLNQDMVRAKARLQSMAKDVTDARKGARNALLHAKEARRTGKPRPNLERAAKAAKDLLHASQRHYAATAPILKKAIAVQRALLHQGHVHAPTQRRAPRPATRRASSGRRGTSSGRRGARSSERRTSSGKRRASSGKRRAGTGTRRSPSGKGSRGTRRSSSPSSSLRRAAGRVHQLGQQTNQILKAMGQKPLTPPPRMRPRSARASASGDAAQAAAEATLAAVVAPAVNPGSPRAR